ncbi:MAG: ATP-binding protein [Candidatus Muiribacteriota bacterium]
MKNLTIYTDAENLPVFQQGYSIKNLDSLLKINTPLAEETKKQSVVIIQNSAVIEKIKSNPDFNLMPVIFCGEKNSYNFILPDFKLTDITDDFENIINRYYFGRKNIPFQMTFEIKSDFEQVRDSIIKIIDKIKNLFKGQDMFYMKLVLDEALINAYKHGNKMDTSKKIKIDVKYYGYKIEFSIEDEGEGFNIVDWMSKLETETDIYSSSGRGLLLIKELMDEVMFKYRGNIINMVKYIN